MGENFIWSITSARKLVNLYRERRILWDTSMPDYRDRLKRHAAWTQIAEYFELDRGIVEKKMKMMVGQYRREVARHGEGVESRWYAYSWLQFLPPVASSQDVIVVNIQDYKEAEAEEINPESLPGSAASSVAEELAEAPLKRICRPPPVQRRFPSAHLRTPSDDRHPDDRHQDDRHSNTCRSRDDAAIYGDYVATKLRNVSPHARSVVQYLVNKILYNAEIGQYDRVDGRKVRIITEQHYPERYPKRNPKRKRTQDPLSYRESSEDHATAGERESPKKTIVIDIKSP